MLLLSWGNYCKLRSNVPLCNKSLSIKDSLIFSLMNSVFTGLNVWYLSNNERNRVVLCLICVAKHLVNMRKSRLSSCSLMIYFIIDHTQVMFIQTFFLAFLFLLFCVFFVLRLVSPTYLDCFVVFFCYCAFGVLLYRLFSELSITTDLYIYDIVLHYGVLT